MKTTISPIRKQQIKKAAQKNGLIFAVIFGSTAVNKKSQKSDLDIAVLTKKEPSYKLFSKLFSDFSNIFKGENVDIRFLNEADPFFRFQVIEKGKLIYGNKQKFQEYFTYAYKNYIDDVLPLFPFQKKLIYQKQEELERAIL